MNKLDVKLIAVSLTIACLLMVNSTKAQSNDPLLFPKNDFTVETKIVKTSSGEKKVTYHSYLHILYVANPVDKDYQSLNISVPVKIDETDINASNAPILFVIGVGGYMSVNNAKSSNGFRPGGGMNISPADLKKDMQKKPEGMLPMIGGPGEMGQVSDRSDLALAAGYVVVSPGCRGRDCTASDGSYYGKAPAAIVDLKAAVCYIRHNKGILPGNTDRIVSVGCSAGGAISSLLGASGNSPLYDSYLREIGAADENDNIWGCAAYSPIADVEHADGAYEWMYGALPLAKGLVDQELSAQLKKQFTEYQESLNLQGKNTFGIITAVNYGEYLLQNYLFPSANKYLSNLTDEKRNEYLTNNKWITYKNNNASFTFSDYVAHVGRMKDLPAFDDFELKQPETIEFGNKTTDARHFTNFSLQYTSGNKNTEIDNEVKTLVNLMNPMYFIGQNSSVCAGYWWLRNGTSDNHTSQTVMVNMATSLENRKKDVNALLFWDGGHCADNDPEGFIEWMGKVTGYVIKGNTRK
jgi:hypothetical protein